MIGRRTCLLLGEIYQAVFSHQSTSGSRYQQRTYTYISRDKLYDFLYEHDYQPWFCNQSKKLGIGEDDKRAVKEWIMKLHTGESLVLGTENWDWKQREQLGQRYLRDLAKDVLNYSKDGIAGRTLRKVESKLDELNRSLELDGYIYRDGQLLFSESAVLDIAEESGILQTLFVDLGLANKQVAMHHLELSEQNYVAGHWSDVITNSRSFLECVLKETAAMHSLKVKKTPLSDNSKPFEVRNYLEHEGVLEAKEKEALAKVYGLLSETGSHPYIAQKDQARLMRILALTFSQFVMLRLGGMLKSASS